MGWAGRALNGGMRPASHATRATLVPHSALGWPVPGPLARPNAREIAGQHLAVLDAGTPVVVLLLKTHGQKKMARASLSIQASSKTPRGKNALGTQAHHF